VVDLGDKGPTCYEGSTCHIDADSDQWFVYK